MGRKKEDKPSAYAWVAYMFTHQPEEMKRVLKYGTPSNFLIKLAEQPVLMTTSEGKTKLVTFPKSLNSNKGQKILHETVVKVDLYLKTIPMQMFDVLQTVKTTVRARRADTQSNIHMVAEAVLHRAACEFKHEVLFAFDSINAWVKSVHKKELGYQTIHKALEVLEEAGIIKVREWGKRGNRSKCTKIEVLVPKRGYILTYTSDLDDWLLYNDHAMAAVYRRESTARLDVLEARIHHFADQLADEVVFEKSRWDQGARLFRKADDRMAVANAASHDVVEIEEDSLTDEDYFNRLLGGLVPTVQANGTYAGSSNAGIRRSD